MGKTVSNPGVKSYGPYDYALGDELRGERATLGKTLLDVQRDLRIKAAYIAAIEDAKPDVFPNPSFIPGYVRSYARYMGFDPDEMFHRFCLESGFVAGAGSAAGPARTKAGAAAARTLSGGFTPDFPLARLPRPGLPEISLSGTGSVLVLIGLVAGLGFGGWTVLQNIQRVRFAPVEDLPVAVAAIDPLVAPDAPTVEEPSLGDLASPVAATALADLYRKQELEVPILVPRDGPIAALDPDKTGLLTRYDPPLDPKASELPAAMVEPGASLDPVSATEVSAAVAPEPLVVVAERAAWIRVYQQNGTVIFERILEKGETYSPPEGIETPLIWAGNAGSVYVRVGDTLHGPLGTGTKAAKGVVLDPKAISDRFGVVEDVPEVISQVFDPPTAQPEAPISVQ